MDLTENLFIINQKRIITNLTVREHMRCITVMEAFDKLSTMEEYGLTKEELEETLSANMTDINWAVLIYRIL